MKIERQKGKEPNHVSCLLATNLVYRDILLNLAKLGKLNCKILIRPTLCRSWCVRPADGNLPPSGGTRARCRQRRRCCFTPTACPRPLPPFTFLLLFKLGNFKFNHLRQCARPQTRIQARPIYNHLQHRAILHTKSTYEYIVQFQVQAWEQGRSKRGPQNLADSSKLSVGKETSFERRHSACPPNRW